jgi:hypothetical protein
MLLQVESRAQGFCYSPLSPEFIVRTAVLTVFNFLLVYYGRPCVIPTNPASKIR